MSGLGPLRSAPLTAAQVLARLNANATIALTAPITTTAQITSTLATGTAPFVVASTTVVGNLNVSQLLGGTWAAPGTIGSTTPNTGKFSAATVGTGATNGYLILSGAAGSNRFERIYTGADSSTSNLRWDIGADGTAEGGANAGSQFLIVAYSDTGGFIDSPLAIVRAAGGAMTLARPVSMSSTLAVTGTSTLAAVNASGNIAAVGNGNTRRIGFNFFAADTWGLYTDGSADAAKMHFRYGTTNYGNLDASGNLTLTGGTNGIGYGTGAGGTATQATSKATGVTLSKTCGTITMNAAALASATSVAFVLTNTAIAATDVVVCVHDSVGTLGGYGITVTPAAGSATVTVRNNTAGSLSEAIVLRFAVIKAVTA